MAVDPLPRHARIHTGPAGTHTLLARWAVTLAAVVVAVITVSCAVFGLAYAVGGSEATEDNWVGLLGAVALLGGLLVSFAAFTLAVVAKAKHERWTPLWLPLSVFPVLLAVVMTAEVLWIE